MRGRELRWFKAESCASSERHSRLLKALFHT